MAASGLAVGTVGWWLARHQWPVAYPDLVSVPAVSGVALLGVLAGRSLGCAPRLRRGAPRSALDPRREVAR